MRDLLSFAREFDLPPKWNDRIVQWNGWEPQLPVIICPPPKTRECCSACASPLPPAVNMGYVAMSTLTTQAMLKRSEENRARLGRLAHKSPSLVRLRLFAYRCQECRHDVVWDIEEDRWWDLDHTDYGPEGSRE